MPGFPIIDSHVHLFDPEQLSYSWMDTQLKLKRRHDMHDFDRARAPVDVEGLVFIEVDADRWGAHLDEARWVAALAAADPRIRAICAAAPLEYGDGVAADLETLMANPRVTAVRRLIQDESAAGFCTRPGFIAGVKQLGRYDLGFDLCVRHWQMADAIELVRQCPDVRIVLDHIGKPAIKDGLLQPWRDDLKTLAALPNVWCKLSGVVTEADHRNWQREQLRPYIEHVIDCFGFTRLMYGSDWPVATLTHAYPQWVDILDGIIGACSETEQRRFYRDNAIGFYRLDQSGR
jgi:L-fuconolactonase